MQFKLTFDIISPFVDKLNPFAAFKALLKYWYYVSIMNIGNAIDRIRKLLFLFSR